MTTKVKAAIPPLVMLIFGFVLLLIIPGQISSGGSRSYVNPQFIPYLMGWFIVILSVISIVIEFIKKDMTSEETGEEEKSRTLDQKQYGKVFAIFSLLVLWAVLIPYLGFVIVTYLFVLGVMLLLGNRNKYQILIVPIAVTTVVYFGIKVFMKVNLPSGIFL
ncbi:tripartite tricarboxylate transporter TctB family protein [Alkalihalobacillus sp. MEB130]|uniref:tripartite tricarboxylate transporter TctB family protein n=1 Tax=Alkalihalobacillus sp. MEB130 TaxID=2976704 RepID=UPI0028DF90E6|nr:tripartite tricarboxylate transporter TctB family protein [Alkalihalobacillus sp. MEB130]MDT8861331.1 tripartite tricarboxylate transporter TctB family protein [Alkalihalobacillus sp. MEB130]